MDDSNYNQQKNTSFWAIYTFPMLQATSIDLQGEI